MRNGSRVCLGIVGMGGMGSIHARNVREGRIPQLELSAIASRVSNQPDVHSDVPHFSSADALIASGKVDAVLIATPHYSHTTIGIAALEAGLHVLVEKPISVHKEDCEKLIATYNPDSGQVFAAMFNQRTDPRYRKLKEMIDDGTLGALQRINWTITDWFRTEAYYRSSDWRATWAGEGGGVLLNQSPHQLDLWQWLFGMPEWITARCQFGRFHDIEVEDSVTAMLEYTSGVQGVFVTTTGEAPGINRLEVAGDNGTAIIDGAGGLRFARNEVPCSEFSKISKKAFAKPEVNVTDIPVEGLDSQHIGILANFTQAILGNEPLISPAVEGVHSVELANAMLLSSIRGRSIQLPINASEYTLELKRMIEASSFRKKPPQTGNGVLDLSESFQNPSRV